MKVNVKEESREKIVGVWMRMGRLTELLAVNWLFN